jgi:excisionase family DNA binding protein
MGCRDATTAGRVVNLSDFPDVGKVADAAACLDCDPRTVYTLIEDGRLDAVRLGRNLRVTRFALLQFLGITDAESEKPTLRVVEGGG